MTDIDELNQKLTDHYGIDSDTGRPIFKVVWANDQTEKRLVQTTDSGIQLLYPEMREVKKYPYIKDRYVLERLVIVPIPNQHELAVKLSYEPLWVYYNSAGEFLHPIWTATKFVIDSVYAAMGKSSLAKYVDDEKNTTEEGRQERVKQLEEELFGDESGLMGKTHLTHEAVVVPKSYGDDDASR